MNVFAASIVKVIGLPDIGGVEVLPRLIQRGVGQLAISECVAWWLVLGTDICKLAGVLGFNISLLS